MNSSNKQCVDYDDFLKTQFSGLKIVIYRHDSGAAESCYPAYIEVELGYNPKDKGSLVKDLGNYISRTFGISYQMCPEYRERGKKVTVRWFFNKKDFEPIRLQILKQLGKESMAYIKDYVPYEFNKMKVQ